MPILRQRGLRRQGRMQPGTATSPAPKDSQKLVRVGDGAPEVGPRGVHLGPRSRSDDPPNPRNGISDRSDHSDPYNGEKQFQKGVLTNGPLSKRSSSNRRSIPTYGRR